MDILKAMEERHSVRSYLEKEVEIDKLNILKNEVELCNELSGLNIQLIVNENSAFSGFIAKYSKFKNVKNYIAMVGKKSDKLDETVGYFGERLVLKCQMLSLNTCWVGLKLITKKGKCKISDDEKLICIIPFGYGESQGTASKSKSFEKVTDVKGDVPDWFRRGVEYALLAPTAINQQKFLFTLGDDNIVSIKETGGVMSKVDLGIVKYHFEVAAGVDNFKWF